ncbi:NAD(P)-dependent oxidoreductase [Arenibaculum pallidiluteum]|uniref:NAD(P)-dependent oxidoreductase n=1 Tax=Arenibaculum pallidiluteum TaxID=2812559 RepID=UPI001A95A90E|nr:NAD(P)-dependent oxidoreductase [Arenibaculum pallidiluteum]
MTDIAFLGLGIMGTGMVRNLLRAGHSVTVWNRTTRDLPEDLKGCMRAASVAEAVSGRERVMLCLTGPEAQRAVILGEGGEDGGGGGLVRSLSAGAIVADATSTDPRLTRALAAAVEGAGATYLDTPVFGSRNEAWEGRLDFVCGGPRDAFDRFRPLLEPMAASIHHLGGTAAGATMKLIGNLLVAAQMASLGEALALARKAGLEGTAVMGVLDVTDYSSALIRGVGRASLAGDFGPHFYLKHMLKDARLIGALAEDLAVPLPATSAIAELYQAAKNEGLGELNASGLHKMLFRMAGLPD